MTAVSGHDVRREVAADGVGLVGGLLDRPEGQQVERRLALSPDESRDPLVNRPVVIALREFAAPMTVFKSSCVDPADPKNPPIESPPLPLAKTAEELNKIKTKIKFLIINLLDTKPYPIIVIEKVRIFKIYKHLWTFIDQLFSAPPNIMFHCFITSIYPFNVVEHRLNLPFFWI